jgi:ribosomal protein L11
MTTPQAYLAAHQAAELQKLQSAHKKNELGRIKRERAERIAKQALAIRKNPC